MFTDQNNPIIIDDSDDEMQDRASPQIYESGPSISRTPTSHHTTVAASSVKSKKKEKNSKKTVPFSLKNDLRSYNNRGAGGSGSRSGERHGNKPMNRRSKKIKKTEIPLDKHSITITKNTKRVGRASPSPSPTPSEIVFKTKPSKLLPRYQQNIIDALAKEKERERLGLPKSRVRIPTMNDPEAAHRKFQVKLNEDAKIEQDINDGYLERVEERHVIELDDLDPELLTGDLLTEEEAAWVARKQARRSGPRSSSWPKNVPLHDQHTEYVRITQKARDLLESDNVDSCSECGSQLRGSSITYPLSKRATPFSPNGVIDPHSPICVGCSRLFSCVKDKNEKYEMIIWITTGLPITKLSKKPSNARLLAMCIKRVKQMRKRARIHFRKIPNNFVTPEELFRDVLDDDFNCCIVGSPMVFEPGKFNSISFDHLLPISLSMDKPDCWSIDNLQPMASCINTVKGNESNKETLRWFRTFFDHYRRNNT